MPHGERKQELKPLVFGASLCIGAIAVFATLAHGVAGGTAVSRFDARYLVTQRSTHRSTESLMGDRIASTISLLGSPAAMALLAVLGAAWLYRRSQWVVLTGWIVAFAGTGTLVPLLKQMIHRPRPVGAELLLYGVSFSFPSGHVAGSAVGFGMLGYLFWLNARQSTGARVLMLTGTALMVGLIAYSRLYLQVHYVSDVLAALAVAVACLAATIGGIEWARAHVGISSRR